MNKDKLKIAIVGGRYNFEFITNYLKINKGGYVGELEKALYFVDVTKDAPVMDWIADNEHTREYLSNGGYRIFENTTDLLAYFSESGLDDLRTVSVSRKRLKELLKAEAKWHCVEDSFDEIQLKFIEENCYKPSIETDL